MTVVDGGGSRLCLVRSWGQSQSWGWLRTPTPVPYYCYTTWHWSMHILDLGSQHNYLRKE